MDETKKLEGRIDLLEEKLNELTGKVTLVKDVLKDVESYLELNLDEEVQTIAKTMAEDEK